MQMQALAARLHATTDRQKLEEIIRDAGACLREARRSVGGLRSSARGTQGLGEAITQLTRQLTETSDIRLRQRLAPDVPPLPPDVEDNLLRIVQEALVNAIRHSSAGTIEITLDHTPQRLNLLVSDDGVGFDSRHAEATRPGHYGLIGMRERAAQIGASLHLDSVPGGGMNVRIELPLPATRAAIHVTANSIPSDEYQPSIEKTEQSLP